MSTCSDDVPERVSAMEKVPMQSGPLTSRPRPTRGIHHWTPGRLTLVAALLALLALTPAALPAQQQRLGRQKDLSAERIEAIRGRIRELQGRAIIGFKPVAAARGMRADGRPALASDQVGRLADGLVPQGVTVRSRFRLIPAVAVRLDPDRLAELLANPDIDYVEPDYRREPVGLPVATPAVAQRVPWGIDRVHAPAAWSITKGAGVKVGIIDTGIDEDNPDLNTLGGINTVTNGAARSDWNDDSPECYSHGTHVAGTVAALDNTSLVVGVAPEVELYAIRVFDPSDFGCYGYDTDIIEGIEWAVDNGLRVVNMSLGSLFPSMALGDAVFAAYMSDLLILAAAGNGGGPPVIFPAAFPHAVAVAAIDSSDQRAAFSRTGPEVEVAGPGVYVESTLNTGGTAFYDGTSMATPHATGVAALIRAAAPALGVADVREILRNTADDILAGGFDQSSGWGVVDALAAVNAVGGGNLALSAVPSDIFLTAAPDGPPVTLPVELRNVGSPGTITWSAMADAGFIALEPTAGSASDAAPGQLDVTADPTGLDIGVHTGFVTVTSDAVNDPVQLRLRMSVAPRIPLDAGVATFGELGSGERHRYSLAGTAGQAIDLLLIRDPDHPNPLPDPFLRLYKPDGELLTFNDDSFFFDDGYVFFGLGFQSLIYSFVLPETGDYFVEVGSYLDCCAGGYVLKAREAGPILAFDSEEIGLRTVENGPPVVARRSVYEATGRGSLSWTASSPDPWISFDPGSGVATAAGDVVAGAPIAPPQPEPAESHLPKRREQRTWARRLAERELRDRRLVEAKLRAPELEPLDRPLGGPAPRATAAAQGTEIEVSVDPASVGIGLRSGTIIFKTEDGWIPEQIVDIYLRVYSQGMTKVSDGQVVPQGVTMDDPDTAIVVTARSLIPVSAGGAVQPPIATLAGPQLGDITIGWDDVFYVSTYGPGQRTILKISRNGAVSSFVELEDEVGQLDAGANGDIFATLGFDKTVRISSDGSAVTPFGPAVGCCTWGLGYRPQDNSVYLGVVRLTEYPLSGFVQVVSLDDGSLRQVGPQALPVDIEAFSREGRVYIVSFDGEIYVLDPEESPDAVLLAVAPTASLHDLALVEGALIMTGGCCEIYRFPVADGPPLGEIVARLGVEEVDALLGEPFQVPLYLDMASTVARAANFNATLQWPPALLALNDVREGEFGGSFVADRDGTGDGILHVSAARADGLRGGFVRRLLILDFSLDESVGPGESVDVMIGFQGLGGPLGEDLLPSLSVTSARICVSDWQWGDVNRDGAVGSGDAVQILRHAVSLPLAAGADVGLGDVSDDGAVNLVDAVQILRHVVDLSVPQQSRVAMYDVGGCP